MTCLLSHTVCAGTSTLAPSIMPIFSLKQVTQTKKLNIPLFVLSLCAPTYFGHREGSKLIPYVLKNKVADPAIYYETRDLFFI